MVKADAEGWNASVRHHIDEGSNFLLVLPNNPQAVEEFCRLFGLPPDCQPKALTRSGFFRLSQFMEPEAFDEVIANWNEDSQVVFVEQLDFPVNRPRVCSRFWFTRMCWEFSRRRLPGARQRKRWPITR